MANLRSLCLLGCLVYACLGTIALTEALSRHKRQSPVTLTGQVTTSSTHHTIDELYCSVSMSGRMCERLHSFDVTSQKLKNVASALAPTVARVGGTSGHFLIFQNDDGSEATNPNAISQWENTFNADFYTGLVGKKNWQNFNCTGSDHAALGNFFTEVGWISTFQINNLLRWNNYWNDFNGKKMIRSLRDSNAPVEGYAISNEPNSYLTKFNITLSSDQARTDAYRLRYFLDRINLTDIKIFGPDVSSLERSSSAANYLYTLLSESNYCDYIDAITLHHYYVNGKATMVEEFVDPNIYDEAKTLMEIANNIKELTNCNKPVYVTETASAYSGGAPDLSNRYAGAMMWLDELAIVALYKGSRVNRQTFWSGSYAMIDFRSYDPTPSYWISLLWKRLIVGGVLNATYTENVNGAFRLYAHCAKTAGPYTSTAGAIVVYYINLLNDDVSLTLNGYETETYKLFLLSQNGLTSNDIFLNGAQTPLTLVNDNVPDIQPQTQNGGPISVAPYGMGFVLIENANAAACP